MRRTIAILVFALCSTHCFAPDDKLPLALKQLIDSIPVAEPEPPPDPANPRTELTVTRNFFLHAAKDAARRALDKFELALVFQEKAKKNPKDANHYLQEVAELQGEAKEYAEETKRYQETVAFVDKLLRDYNDGRITPQQALDFAHKNIVPHGYTPPWSNQCPDLMGSIR